MTTEHKTLAAALAAFQAEMPRVHKGKKANVGQYSYTYADLADITAAVAPVLAKHGLAFAGSARVAEGARYEVVGILSHASGEEREGALPISGGSPQQLGSSITYMRRYLFGIMTGIVTDDDEDGALASRPAPQPQRQAPPPQAPPTPTAPDDKPVTDNTRKRMFALFNEKGIADEQQLPGINHVTGKQYTSRADITEADAQTVIEQLKGQA